MNKPERSNGTIQTPRETTRRHSIRICLGSSCYSKAKRTNLEYIEQYLQRNNLTNQVDFVGHLCIERCNMGPNVEIDGIMYHEVYPGKLKEILKHHFGME